MTWPNLSDVTDQLRAAGLLLDTARHTHGGALAGDLIIDSAKPIRCRVDDGKREERGWYWLQQKQIRDQTYITGAYGTWEGASNQKYAVKLTLDGKAISLSDDERAAIKARHAENIRRAAAMRRAEADRAAVRARAVWSKYLPSGQSAYLVRKSVQAHGLRYDPNGAGTVAVPMLRGGHLVGLQIIRGPQKGEGARRKLEKEYFPAGMDKSGAHHLLGRAIAGGVCLVAEGYATGATLFEALGQTIPVAIAFDAGSLLPVCLELRKTYPRLRILVAADDDHIQKCRAPIPDHPERLLCGKYTDLNVDTCQHCGRAHQQKNPGTTAAANAAHAVDGAWCKPEWPAPPPDTAPNGKARLTDYNDLHLAAGLHEVRLQLERHLTGLGWYEQRPGRPAHTTGSGAASAGAGERETLPGIIDELEALERYSLVYGGSGTLFDHREHQLIKKSDVMDVLEKSAWNALKVRGGLPVVRLEEVGFDPAGTDRAITCNLWRGWPTQPKAGNCEAILNLLDHLCSGEQNARDLYQWVLRWLAYPLQHPGAKMKTALVFHGPQGVGKNLFFECVMAIYGEYGRVVDQSAIEDKFNDWASRKLFLIADEVVTRAEIWHVKNKLKHFVTGDTIRINPKNMGAYTERNHVNMVYLSNERQPIPLEKDDRRHLVIWTPEKLSEHTYRQVVDEIRAGGIPALHQFLLDLDLAGFDEHTKPPMSGAKADLIDISLESTERFLRDWQAGDIELGHDDTGPRRLPYCPCASSDLYLAYKKWCVHEGVSRPREQAAFMGHLAKLPGWSRTHKDVYSSLHHVGATRRQRMIVQSATALTEALGAGQNDDWRQKSEQSQAAWLTDCFFAFRNALDHHP